MNQLNFLEPECYQILGADIKKEIPQIWSWNTFDNIGYYTV